MVEGWKSGTIEKKFNFPPFFLVRSKKLRNGKSEFV